MLTLPLAMLTIILTAAAVSTFLAFLAAKRDGDICARCSRVAVASVPTARRYREEAAQHYTEARRYLLVSNVSAVAALIAWVVLVVA